MVEGLGRSPICDMGRGSSSSAPIPPHKVIYLVEYTRIRAVNGCHGGDIVKITITGTVAELRPLFRGNFLAHDEQDKACFTRFIDVRQDMTELMLYVNMYPRYEWRFHLADKGLQASHPTNP